MQATVIFYRVDRYYQFPSGSKFHLFWSVRLLQGISRSRNRMPTLSDDHQCCLNNACGLRFCVQFGNSSISDLKVLRAG